MLEYIKILESYAHRQPPSEIPPFCKFVYGKEEYRINIHHAGRIDFFSRNIGAKGSYNPNEHIHDFYHIVLFIENEDFFTLNGELFKSTPGILALTSPSDRHNFSPFYRNPFSYTEISFAVVGRRGNLRMPINELFKVLLNLNVNTGKRPVQIGKRQTALLKNKIHTMVNLLADSNPTKKTSGYLALLDILIHIATEYLSEEKHVRELSVISPLELVKEEIRLKHASRLKIHHLAKLAGMSPNYFHTRFKQEFGLSPIRYQQELRIEQAKKMLRETPMSCGEIALKTGFNDQYFFSRTFKNLTGISPNSWRRNLLKD